MTTVEAAATRGAAPREGAASPGLERTDLRLVSALVVLVVLTQRIGIPLSGQVITVAVPLTYAFVAVELARGVLTVSRSRGALFAVAASACLLATLAMSGRGFSQYLSTSSLELLLIIYLPYVLRVHRPHGREVVTRAGRTFVWTMLVLSAVGLVQITSQLAGLWQWQDYLKKVLPPGYTIPGYNFSNYLYYGSGLNKSTAFVMLEPSFLSQLCALAILIGMMLHIRAWQLLLLAGGMASSVSGTGIVLLAAGGVLMLVRAPKRLRPGYLIAGAVAGALVIFSPVGPLLLNRQGEVGQGGTSGNARFVAPYTHAWQGLHADVTRYWRGAGAGSVDRLIGGPRVGVNGSDIVYSIVPKLVFEYGFIAGGLFAVFILVAILYRAPWRVVPGSLVVMVFLLSGALLQPQTAFLAWLLSGIGASERPTGRDPVGSG